MQQHQHERLGWSTSIVGLGCGGHSRLGQRQGASDVEAARIVRAAVDAGVSFIDTARSYRTESAVGIGLEGISAEQVRVASKASVRDAHGLRSVADVRADLNTTLRSIQREHLDLFQLHAVSAEDYPYIHDTLVPALLEWKQQGLIGGLGITERFHVDTEHHMLQRALLHDCWDSVMVGYNMLNQTAAKTILPLCEEKGVTSLIMFAVRKVFSYPEHARIIIQQLIDNGELQADALDPQQPFIFAEQLAGGIPATAYRFCRHSLGAHIILTGTGSEQHLHENIQAIQAPALSDDIQNHIRSVFANVHSVSGG